MTSLLRKLTWKPSTVSWLSLVLMGSIVTAVGLAGTSLVVNYLENRLMAHGIEHNREIAETLVPKLEALLLENPDEIKTILRHTIRDYKDFGFRIYVIDKTNQSVIADSEKQFMAPVPLKGSLLSDVTALSKAGIQPGKSPVIRFKNELQHPMLIWIEEMRSPVVDRQWVVGIAKDQKTLTDFMGDLHWQLIAVLLLTYLLITLLGYFAMRATGRAYERRLESQITERTQALKEAHENILHKTRLATIGQTATMLTHEMRNPLASIKLALSNVKNSGSLQNREQRRVELVLGEVDRLDSLLSETLDYARPVNLSREPVDIDDVVSQVIRQQHPLLEQKNIHLAYEIDSHLPGIRMDQAQMLQVFLNLIKNAIEACPESGHICIRMTFLSDEQVLQISIKNNFTATSENQLSRAFEPFYTTKPRGTGLGLGLVKRVIEEHGGSVEIGQDNDFVDVNIMIPLRRSILG